MKKKEIITLSVTGCVAVLLILLYCFVFAPMLKTETEYPKPDVREGEGTYLGSLLTLYPEVPNQSIVSIEVENELDSYTFYARENEKGEREIVIKGHEKLAYDATVYAYLNVYTRLPVVPQDTNVYRDVDPSEMAKYGLTDDTCTAKFKITYLENGEEKSHTVLIGDKIMASTSIYYAAYEGRNHVYTMNAQGIDGAILKPLTSYITPNIYHGFQNASTAVVYVDFFGLFVTTDPFDETGESLSTVLQLQKDRKNSSDTSAVFYLNCPTIGEQGVIASTNYISAAFGQLFTAFRGEEVVAILPPEKEARDEILSEYGLAVGQEHYMVYAKGKKETDDALIMYISKEIDGYHYVISTYLAEETVVKVPAEQLYFLGDGEETAVRWTATNSVYAGFNNYLKPNPDINEPGISTIRIYTKGSGINYGGYDVTFNIKIKDDGSILISSTDGKYVYDTSKNTSAKIDGFSTLYAVLIAMPKPQRFSNLTDEEKLALQTQDNLVYELEVVLNSVNGVREVKKYSYYLIDAGYCLCVTELGTLDADNNYTQKSVESVFETMSAHISNVAQAYEKTLKGEHYIQNDYIS